MLTPWGSWQIWHHHKWPIFCSCVYESLPLIPYEAELSDAVRRICRQYNIRTLFQSAPTLCGRLMQVKDQDQDPLEKHSNVVYKVPRNCGWVYIGATKRALETRVKKHKPDTRRGELKKSAIAQHASSHHQWVHWDEVVVSIDAVNNTTLLIKEALHPPHRHREVDEQRQRHHNIRLLDGNYEPCYDFGKCSIKLHIPMK